MKRFVPFVLALALFAGCGGSGPTDEDQIRVQVADFTNAMVLQDQAAACDTFAPGLVAQFDDGTNGCDQSAGPLGRPDDWQDLEISEINIPQDGVANVMFADVGPRKRQAQEDYGQWLARQVGCLRTSCGPDMDMPVTLLRVDLIRLDGDWLIADFDVAQP